jgi:amino acid adenylation domain-containing protein
MTLLHDLLINSARLHPDKNAVEEPGDAAITYRELDRQSSEIRGILRANGVVAGDRVGVYVPKSISSVVAVFGILKSDAAYVPVDPQAPPARVAYIFGNCSVKAMVVDKSLLPGLLQAFGETELPVIGEYGENLTILAGPPPSADAPVENGAGLAYILYTSGSTGRPKGVMISHSAAMGFVDWCSETFEPNTEDRFSSHSPFHFDLSVFDLYVSIKHGATVVLIGEELGKQPLGLTALIPEKKITIWYSTPSILRMMIDYGKFEEADCSSLRQVLFAGEVFPVKYLRQLQKLVPKPRYFNLYGPTETNVCTYLEIPKHIPEERTEPYPIGVTCSHYRSSVRDEDGSLVPYGSQGELYMIGVSLLRGYWGLPEQTAKGFYTDSEGTVWYKTGDLVRETDGGVFLFDGRRDRMVKRRSYRVELGEIEAALYRHSSIAEAAVVALPDEESGVLIKAYYSCAEGKRLSTIELKQFCSQQLPKYMIPDRFGPMTTIPKTSTDKTDYQALKAMA